MVNLDSVPHPGVYIRAAILKPRGLTISAGARLVRTSRVAFSNVVTGVAALSPEMALRLEKVFDIPMELLLQHQLAYDVALTRARHQDIKVTRYREKKVA